MKRLAVSFGILVVLLAIAGVLTLIAGATSSEGPDDALPANSAGAVSAEKLEPAAVEPDEAASEGTDDAASEGPSGQAPFRDAAQTAASSESAGAVADGAERAVPLVELVMKAVKDMRSQLDARLKWLAEKLVEGGSIVLNNAPLSEEQAESIVLASSNYDSRVIYIDQREKIPYGCEIVALSVAMKAEGFDVSPIDIADNHMVYGTSVAHEYRGSPYVNGGGLPPCIVDAANSWLSANGGEAHAYNLTGTSFDGLLQLVERGYPLVVWTTENMGSPRFVGKVEDGLQWYTSEHCVVLYGVEGDQVLVSDSLEGLVKRDRERFANIYEACGRKSMFVLPEKGPLR